VQVVRSATLLARSSDGYSRSLVIASLFALLASIILVGRPFPAFAYPEIAADGAVYHASAATGDIVDLAVADGRFTTLVTALQAADLVGTLQSDGPFTVFAPTDDAFAQLPAGTVEALLADPTMLKNVLLYHVVPGAVMAADVVQLDQAPTAAGQMVSISTTDMGVMVNGSHVIITDIVATNGVIHVVDAVLLPPAM
jgi:transforming growth factor-beta-induced protein